jgi:uncharacterized protein
MNEPVYDVVDVWAQQPTEQFMQQPWLATLLRWTGLESEPVSTADTLAEMDRANVSIALLSAWHAPEGDLIPNRNVAAVVDEHPDRFRGLVSVDPRDPVRAVAELRAVVRDHNFVGLRFVPWLWDLPPYDRLLYPLYTACVELGIAFCTQIGHTGPLRRSEPGRPIPYLEDILLDFPDLVVVGGHVGVPWIDEVIFLLDKFPNFYVDTSAYVTGRLPAALVDYMRDRRSHRVMFGTNWPMLSATRCLRDLKELQLTADGRHRYLSGNAQEVFKL